MPFSKRIFFFKFSFQIYCKIDNVISDFYLKIHFYIEENNILLKN